MSEITWIKLKTEMFADDKIRLIESMPESDAIIIIWIKLLTQAGKTNANGYIFLNENVPFTEEMLSTLFNRPLSTVRLALRTLEQFEMISIDEKGYILIENWEKHQNVEGMERVRELTRVRVQRYRERQKQLPENVTLPNVTVTKQNKNKSKNNIYTQNCVNEFNKFWDLYDKKVGKKDCLKKWNKLNDTDKEKIFETLPEYIKATPDKKYRKNPLTYLNGECWEDEEIISNNGRNPENSSHFITTNLN